MDATVRIIVKDPEVSAYKEIAPTEPFRIRGENVLLDGPVSDRVAVLDFEPGGALRRGVPFEGGVYRVVDPDDLGAADVACTSVFGTVFKVLSLFEDEDALGRRARWAFGGPQLLVVPFAGEWDNAFYERDSRSLQLFSFRPVEGGPLVHACHSQDIVAHEAAHAVLDGIAPDLYHAVTPQALALHEAIADVTAALCALRSRPLVLRVLQPPDYSIERSSAFSALAEQFAYARSRLPYLRDLTNALQLGQVDDASPHQLSVVLSGALYAVLVKLYDELRADFAGEARLTARADSRRRLVEQVEVDEAAAADEAPAEAPDRGRAGAVKALAVATMRFKRTLFRGLDYLPAGEVSFADFARAILAADQASHPESDAQRTWLRREFCDRGIVGEASELDVRTQFEDDAVSRLDLPTLVESDWAAYEFANRNRKLLGIPKNVPFRVLPRLDVTKKYYHHDRREKVRECIFKVSWTVEEPNDLGAGWPARRQYTAGTTLAIDWETRRVRALLGSDPRPHAAARGRFLRALAGGGFLSLGRGDQEARWRRSFVQADVVGGTMRVQGASRALHLVREEG